MFIKIRRLRTKEKNPQKKQNSFSEHENFSEEKKIWIEDSVEQEYLRILHVDDDASFLNVSKIILESENKFEIDTATSVDEAFCKLKTQTYDAIVCDYGMPQKNGLDFLKELRDQKNNIAFVIFACGTEEVVIRAINLGADYYINKSGSSEAVYNELADAIQKIAKRKKEERSIRWK